MLIRNNKKRIILLTMLIFIILLINIFLIVRSPTIIPNIAQEIKIPKKFLLTLPGKIKHIKLPQD